MVSVATATRWMVNVNMKKLETFSERNRYYIVGSVNAFVTSY